MVPKGGLDSEAPHIAGDTHTPELPSQGFLEVPIDLWGPMTCLQSSLLVPPPLLVAVGCRTPRVTKISWR